MVDNVSLHHQINSLLSDAPPAVVAHMQYAIPPPTSHSSQHDTDLCAATRYQELHVIISWPPISQKAHN